MNLATPENLSTDNNFRYFSKSVDAIDCSVPEWLNFLNHLNAHMETLCYFMFLGKPLPISPEYCDAGGAYINAWVAHADQAIAEHIARDAIADEQWHVEQLEEQAFVSREHYKNLPESLKCFEQAVLHGYCLTFDTWPIDAEDSDEAPLS